MLSVRTLWLLTACKPYIFGYGSLACADGTWRKHFSHVSGTDCLRSLSHVMCDKKPTTTEPHTPSIEPLWEQRQRQDPYCITAFITWNPTIEIGLLLLVLNRTTSMTATTATNTSAKDSLSSLLGPLASLVAPHEDAVARDPFSVKTWIAYLDALDDCKMDAKNDKKNKNETLLSSLEIWHETVSKRAVQKLPKSLKLWKLHWEGLLKQQQQQQQPIEKDCACFETALTTLSAFPRVWMVYLQFLLDALVNQQQQQQNQEEPNDSSNTTMITITFCRRTIDRALQALPLTQHASKLWDPILKPFLLQHRVFPLETRARLLHRYAGCVPSFSLEYGQWCQRHGLWGKAAVAYQTVLLNTNSSNHDDGDDTVWQAFGTLCVQHSAQVEAVGIPWEDMVRTTLQQLQQQQEQKTQKPEDSGQQVLLVPSDNDTNTSKFRLLHGMLYHWLATAWVHRGAFGLARSAYEEGLTSVTTVRDFAFLYQAYLQLEEGLLQHAVEALEQGEEDEEEENQEDPDDWDILLETTATSPLAEMELAVARAEHLTQRRPLLLNAVKLRQDAQQIDVWLERGKLYLEQQPRQAASVLHEALRTVHPSKQGRAELVVTLAQVYTDHLQNVQQARDLFRDVCVEETIPMTHSEDLTTCWTSWIELELRHEQWDEALKLARQSVAPKARKDAKKDIKTTHRRHRRPNLTLSLRLWDLRLDLEESLGTVQTTKDAYNRALETKAATVQHVLNYTAFLSEHKYFEESFAAYERGIELFGFPHAGAQVLWKAYLTAFLWRYQENQVERTRDLFQRCLESCPREVCAEFYAMNGSFEEEHGLTKRALSVYRDMCHRVPSSDKLTAYQLYIIKTQKYLGLTATREIYQEAIEVLEDLASAKMCIEFSKMETSLQQFERARAILTYGSQMADPRRLPEFWKFWNDFEIENGNEETFREMLRVKRSVEAAFSTSNYNATGMDKETEKLSQEEAMRLIASQEGVEVNEPPKTAVAGFVSSKRSAASANLDDVEERVAKLRKATGQQDDVEQDDNEIDLDDIDAEIEEAAAEGATAAVADISTKNVPAAVFGGLAKSADASSPDAP